ncbi:MAG: phosphatidylserine decarboxylase [Lentisphaeraceae bacterium]|nr:phosphatidylserine decarboxylase [Lentisphaeraceae bacterium]
MTRVVGFFASLSISKIAIRRFAKRYNINLDEMADPIDSFENLNSFFIRTLKEGTRPIASKDNSKAVVSPVDGAIAQYGRIEDGRIIQAKGKSYCVEEFLGDAAEAAQFKDGQFMTIYLAPTDYHRIHHYIDAKVTGFRYIPGQLFPVNPFSVSHIDNLFPINERLTTYFESNGKAAALVKVGATIVGKIKVTYSDVESTISKQGRAETYSRDIPVKKGDELGYFAMGSTVVMLFPKDSFEFIDALPADNRLQVGQLLGHWK